VGTLFDLPASEGPLFAVVCGWWSQKGLDFCLIVIEQSFAAAQGWRYAGQAANPELEEMIQASALSR